MVDWTLYELLLGNGIQDRRDSTIASAVSSFAKNAIDNPDYRADAECNGVSRPILANRKSAKKCQIKALPGDTFNIGDIVTCFGSEWIVKESYLDAIGLCTGEMWVCNGLLRFQNGTPQIFVRPCVIDDGSYSESGDSTAPIINNKYTIYITLDDATKYIYVDKRISLGKTYNQSGDEILEVYEITWLNDKSVNYSNDCHLLSFDVVRGVYDESKDNISQVICDYISDNSQPSVISPSQSTGGRVVISGRSNVKIGTTYKYRALFYDSTAQFNAGITNANVIPQWSVIKPTGVGDTITSGDCLVNIPLSDILVGQSLTITAFASGDSNNVTYGQCTMEVRIVS